MHGKIHVSELHANKEFGQMLLMYKIHRRAAESLLHTIKIYVEKLSREYI